MSGFLQLITLLVIILFAAKLAGRASTRLGLPSVFGEISIGVLLGPSLLNLTAQPFVTDNNLFEFIDHLGEIGVLLLMFLAGMELHLGELKNSSRVALYSGTLGVILPVLLGFLAGVAFHMDVRTALFLGLTLAATSVSISAQTLLEMGKLKTRVGTGLMGAAVFDDILVILLFSIFQAAFTGNLTLGGIAYLVLRMAFYFALAGFFGYYLLPVLTRIVRRTGSENGTISFCLIVLFVFGVSAEVFGNMAAITGTFMAGLFFTRTKEKDIIVSGISNLAYGFFVPIFFICIGLKTNLRLFSPDSMIFLLVMVLIAVISKILGSGLGARAGGYSWLESYQLGNGMVSRGEVGLIIASIGASTGLINTVVLTDIVILILLTTLITPLLLKLCFSNPPGFLNPSQPELKEPSLTDD
jgi:Kef-type K+ transport system membrane component KefB